MTISCMIVDDEPLAVKLLESFVTKTPELKLLGSFTDSVEAINAIKEQQPDLLFLDIQMPDLNGMELAHMIPSDTCHLHDGLQGICLRELRSKGPRLPVEAHPL